MCNGELITSLGYLHCALRADPDNLTPEEIAQIKAIAQMATETMTELSQAILAAIVGIIFAVFAFIAWNELRNFDQRIKRETERLESSVSAMSKASQKLMAGYQLSIKGEHVAALALYKEAADAYPTLYNAYNAMGWAYIELGNPDAAIEAFRSAQRLRPQDIESYSDLAAAYMKKGDEQAALRAVAETLKRDPNQADYFKTPLYEPLWSNPQFKKMIGLN